MGKGKSKKGKKVYYTDFDQLERSSYKTLTGFAREIIDKMVEMSLGVDVQISPEVQAKIDLVLEGFKDLTDRQKLVLEYTFGLNSRPTLTEREIAKEMDIAKTSVHELKKRALTSLHKRVSLNEDVVKDIKNSKK